MNLKNIIPIFLLIFSTLVSANDMDTSIHELQEQFDNTNKECDRKINEIPNSEIIRKLVPAYDSSFSVSQYADRTMFDESHMATIKMYEETVYECYKKMVNIVEGTSVEDDMLPLLSSVLRARMFIMGGLVNGEYSYGAHAQKITNEITFIENAALDKVEKRIDMMRQELLARERAKENIKNQQAAYVEEDSGFLSKLGDALLNRLATGGRGRTTWMFGGGSGFSTCRSLNDFSGQVYSFQGACPVGFAPTF
jgi:hypothetical protein